jgi:uncharacterized protein YdeI (YjbR/CyaY-like superfamily)
VARDPRVDAYIDKSAEFAKPILAYLRDVVHEGCPDVQETIKWGMPAFEHHGLMCGMAAFKAHCTFSFWKGALVLGADGAAGEDAMGQFGRITKRSDLPPKRTLVGYVRKVAALNEEGTKVPRPARQPRPELPVPDDLARALRGNRKAATTFENFPPSHRREYIEWITEAKGDATRRRRLEQTVEWLAEGKSRNWKYVK